MNRPVSHALNPWWIDTTARVKAPQLSMIAAVALAATSVWAALLYLASWEVGFSFEASWSVPVLLAIFGILMLGLKMNASASQNLARDNGNGSPDA